MLKPTEGATVQPLSLDAVQQAVLRVLAYRQVFDCPQSVDEIWHFLDTPGVSAGEVGRALRQLQTAGLVAGRDGSFWVAEMDDPTERWLANRSRADDAMPEALAVGRGLMHLPFVDGVGISGSLSKRSLAEDGDFGTHSEAVLIHTQAQLGLTADGICGPKSWTAILER